MVQVISRPIFENKPGTAQVGAISKAQKYSRVVKISAGLSTGGGVLGFHGVGPCSEILGPIPKRKGSFQIGVRKYFGF